MVGGNKESVEEGDTGGRQRTNRGHVDVKSVSRDEFFLPTDEFFAPASPTTPPLSPPAAFHVSAPSSR